MQNLGALPIEIGIHLGDQQLECIQFLEAGELGVNAGQTGCPQTGVHSVAQLPDARRKPQRCRS